MVNQLWMAIPNFIGILDYQRVIGDSRGYNDMVALSS